MTDDRAKKAYERWLMLRRYSHATVNTEESFIDGYQARAQENDANSEKKYELKIFLQHMYEAVKIGRIRDFDTDWRMLEKVLPSNLECLHSKDPAEISGTYRKVHLSDILSAACEFISLSDDHGR